MLPWVLCAALAVAAAALAVKLRLLQNGLDEIARQLAERLEEDTNNPIFLSTRDPGARKLAAGLNLRLKELRRARRRYEAGDRELKEAVTNVSHDLRTPLTAICGYLELLEREEKSPAAERYLALISGRAQAMVRLTEELLHCFVALSAQEELHPEPVDLNAALEESAAGLYAALTARGITPSVRLPRERVICRADRGALSRVFGNILNNALKYSGGDLEIVLTPKGEVSFSNAAPGLDEVQVGRLFDRFFTVESAGGSTGLGLSIARALTERMGGTADARYQEGRLTIYVSFPLWGGGNGGGRQTV